MPIFTTLMAIPIYGGQSIDQAGLDTDYPYTKEREAKDTPGINITSLDKEITLVYKFQMYLMYKPTKEGAIFIPLRVTDWDWNGVLKWDSQTKKTNCNVTRTEQPRDKAAQKYPEWTQILKEKTPWDPGKQERTTCP